MAIEHVFFFIRCETLTHALSEIEIRNYSARKKESSLHWLWARPDSIRIFGSKRNKKIWIVECWVRSFLLSIVFTRITLSLPFDGISVRRFSLPPFTICIHFFQILHRRSSFILILFPIYKSNRAQSIAKIIFRIFQHLRCMRFAVRMMNSIMSRLNTCCSIVDRFCAIVFSAFSFPMLQHRISRRQITNELRTVTSRRFRMTFKSITYIFIVLGRFAFGDESRWSVDLAKYCSLVGLSRKHHIHHPSSCIYVFLFCAVVLFGCPSASATKYAFKLKRAANTISDTPLMRFVRNKEFATE